MANLTKVGAWIEGETEAQDLVFSLANEIVNASIPNDPITDEPQENRWVEHFSSEGDMWVTYTQSTPATNGSYKHTDGKSYTVYKVVVPSTVIVDANRNLEERILGGSGSTGTTLGRLIPLVFSYVDNLGATVQVDLEGRNIAFVDDAGVYKGYLMEQFRTLPDGSTEYDSQWNEFRILAEIPTVWSTLFAGSTLSLRSHASDYTQRYSIITSVYNYPLKRYTADVVNILHPTVILKGEQSVPVGVTPVPVYVRLEQPPMDFNHINVTYGLGCVAIGAVGDPLLTYDGACDPMTVQYGKSPTIISQTKARELYESWNGGGAKVFEPYKISWQVDLDGVTQIISPVAKFYYGRHSTISWVVNKKRRPDFLVDYSISLTSDRIMIVLEGDPSPGIEDYYRSFAYIGKIIGFNDTDHLGNFGVTVGMGDLDTAKTGYTLASISEKNNPAYAGWGEHTSNGMYSMSMLDTKGRVKFQAHYPAFLTQLPNYSSVGTIPADLSRLILDGDGFQPSIWTDRYHASPVYMVHQAEGYRGYLDGVVAIHDHNLISGDELLVDSEIWKDELDHTKGTYTEVYKFFSLKSPVNMFKYSPAPDRITVAIIKEIV